MSRRKKKPDSASGLEYLAIFNGTGRTLLKRYSYEEIGKIISWALEYHLDGIVPDFTDEMNDTQRSLAVMFDQLRDAVDAFATEKEQQSETNRNNVNARWNNKPANADPAPADPEAAPALSDYSVECTDSEHIFTLDEIRRLEETYPGVNVRFQLERLRIVWNEQPEKRTTEAGLDAYLVNWFGIARKDTPTAVDLKPVKEGANIPWRD